MSWEKSKAVAGSAFFAGIILLALLLAALLGGCGEGPTYPSTPFGGPPHDVKSYSVEYRVIGQFGKAAVIYRDKYGMQVEAGEVRPGWSERWNESIDYTNYPFKGLSLMVLAQDTTGAGSGRDLTVEIWVDGELLNSATKPNPGGASVVVQAHAGVNNSGKWAAPVGE
jgi:hypothetical protein